MKAGDDVCVRLPKKKDLLVRGVIKYIGPVEEESSAVWFGVELVVSTGSSQIHESLLYLSRKLEDKN